MQRLISFDTVNATSPIPVAAASEGVGLRPLDSCHRGFESHREHVCLFLVLVLCYVGSGLCDVLITRSEKSYRLYESNCV